MDEIRQQDIVWVRFPYSDMKEWKFRPAVVISNNKYNKKSPDVVACAITSKLEEKDYTILIDESNITTGRLPVKSRIRADKIVHIEKQLIPKSFAQVNNKTFDMLTEEIKKLIKRSSN